MTLAVRARQMEVRYARGAAPAVSGVDLDVPPGSVLLVVGSAGSGKSSLLHGLLGLAPAFGEVTVLGYPAGHPAALGRTGFAPQGRPVEPRLSAREIAVLVATLRGAPARDVDDAFAAVDLADPDTLAGRLDPQEMRRLTLALARIGTPDLVILDDPWEMPETVETVIATRKRGATTIVATEQPGTMAGLADATVTLSEGRLL